MSLSPRPLASNCEEVPSFWNNFQTFKMDFFSNMEDSQEQDISAVKTSISRMWNSVTGNNAEETSEGASYQSPIKYCHVERTNADGILHLRQSGGSQREPTYIDLQNQAEVRKLYGTPSPADYPSDPELDRLIEEENNKVEEARLRRLQQCMERDDEFRKKAGVQHFYTRPLELKGAMTSLGFSRRYTFLRFLRREDGEEGAEDSDDDEEEENAAQAEQEEAVVKEEKQEDGAKGVEKSGETDDAKSSQKDDIVTEASGMANPGNKLV